MALEEGPKMKLHRSIHAELESINVKLAELLEIEQQKAERPEIPADVETQKPEKKGLRKWLRIAS